MEKQQQFPGLGYGIMIAYLRQQFQLEGHLIWQSVEEMIVQLRLTISFW